LFFLKAFLLIHGTIFVEIKMATMATSSAGSRPGIEGMEAERHFLVLFVKVWQELKSWKSWSEIKR